MVVTLLVAQSSAALAREEQKTPPPDRWQDTAELSYVVTAGNSETDTLGFKNKLWRQWEKSAFELNAGGVRANATTTTTFALGTMNNFDVTEKNDSNLTAETYYLNGRYDRKIIDSFFWFVAAGWDRNRFAGVQNRYTGVAGVGNIWTDTDRRKFRTDYSLTFTKQVDVVDNPSVDGTFLGARIASSYFQKCGANTTYTNDLVLDENLDDTADFRANMINGLSVAMNKRLALKVTLQWLYDHRPSFESVDLFDPLAPPPAGARTGTVLVALDELDTIFTTSLAITF
jgi:putative salt-induced outer membrane protein YdiY